MNLIFLLKKEEPIEFGHNSIGSVRKYAQIVCIGGS